MPSLIERWNSQCEHLNKCCAVYCKYCLIIKSLYKNLPVTLYVNCMKYVKSSVKTLMRDASLFPAIAIQGVSRTPRQIYNCQRK